MASAFSIRLAAHQLLHGGIIIYPTDTIYGLGCDPMDYHAVAEINRLKHRAPNKNLILIAHSLSLFADYIEPLTEAEQKKISATTQPTSWIVKAKTTLPAWLSNWQGTLAIRITSHPVITELCQRLGHPLVSTSANPSGKKTCRNAMQAHQYFHDKVDFILIDDRYSSGQPSVIKTIDNQTTLRK